MKQLTLLDFGFPVPGQPRAPQVPVPNAPPLPQPPPPPPPVVFAIPQLPPPAFPRPLVPIQQPRPPRRIAPRPPSPRPPSPVPPVVDLVDDQDAEEPMEERIDESQENQQAGANVQKAGKPKKRVRDQSHDENVPPQPTKRRRRDSGVPRGPRIPAQPEPQPPETPIGDKYKDPNDWEQTDWAEYEDNPEMKEILDHKWQAHIRTFEDLVPGEEIYNLRLGHPNLSLPELLKRIYRHSQTAYHINIDYGYILAHRETGHLRYFYAQSNTRAFMRDKRIRSMGDVTKMIKELDKLDPAETAFQGRPDTKWVLHMMTNAVVTVHPLPKVIGGRNMKLPSLVRLNRGLLNFSMDASNHSLTDGLCFFRCATYHYLCQRNVQGLTDLRQPEGWVEFNRLAKKHHQNYFAAQKGLENVSINRGMPFNDLDIAERHFKCPIYVYQLDPYVNEFRKRKKAEEDGEPDGPVEIAERERQLRQEAIKRRSFSARLIRRPDEEVIASPINEARAMHLNMVIKNGRAHFSYIHNLNLYSKSYACPTCSRPFHRLDHLRQHEPRCHGDRVLNLYPGYACGSKPTVFEQLEKKYDIYVPEQHRYHPYYATHDWECYFKDREYAKLEQPMDLGQHLSLPDPDPDTSPPGMPHHLRELWLKLHTRIGPSLEYCVVREPHKSRVVDYMKAMAKLQIRRFVMSASVHFWNNGLRTKQLPTSGKITNAAEFLAYVTKIDEGGLVTKAVGNHKILALEIHVSCDKQDTTADLFPASCAIATNVPGFTDPATGRPKAEFMLSDGNPQHLVAKFVKGLTKMSAKSARIMRKRFSPVFKRLELKHDRYLREVFGLIRNYMVEEPAIIVKALWKLLGVPRGHPNYDEATVRITAMHTRLAYLDIERPEFLRQTEAAYLRLVRDKREMHQEQNIRNRVRRQNKSIWGMTARSLELEKLIKKFKTKIVENDFDGKQKAAFYDALRHIKDIKRLYKDLEAFCTCLTVFGFNSAKFDLNLIRKQLLPELNIMHSRPVLRLRARHRGDMAQSYLNWRLKPPRSGVNIIKRGNAYLSIQTNRLRFLDMANFIAPGTSYEKWLKSRKRKGESEGDGEKFHFPYEWFKDLDQLAEPLPPKEAFFSTLKGHGITDADYAMVQAKWASEGWQNMRDHLEFYNKQDVVPFLAGIESMRQFFMQQCKIDFIGGSAISLPGISERRINSMLPPHTFFALPQKTRRVDNSDLLTMVKDGIVGGPAITFRRYAKAGETVIRDKPGGNVCKKIIGFDATSLYGWCTDQLQACQLPKRWDRQADGSFVGKQLYRNTQTEISWIEWEAFCRQTKIYHRFNGGLELFGRNCVVSKSKFKPEQSEPRELRIAGVSVDGYDPETKTCYFLDGCIWHYHIPIDMDPKSKRYGLPEFQKCPIREKLLARKTKFQNFGFNDRRKAMKIRRKDFRKREHLRSEGYKVVVMPECDWLKCKRKDHDPRPKTYMAWCSARDPVMYEGVYEITSNSAMTLRHFLESKFNLPHPQPYGDMYELLDSVRNGDFFGIVEVDIGVPDNLKDHFAKLTPIFKNCDVNVKDVGDHTEQFIRRNKLENKFPRRSLIGSYQAYKVPMITPLLRWYLEHDLQVVKVHRAVQYKGIACFHAFCKKVEEARRHADLDKDWAPIGEMEKLLCNAGYGKSVTELMRHILISILDTEKAQEKANDPFFKTYSLLDRYCVETCMDKERIRHNLNYNFGFFVYNYAKLRMLSFYYDFIAKYIPRDRWELILMDTDSFYLAISGDSLDDIVPEENREAYAAVRNQFLPRLDEPGATYDRRVFGLFHVEFKDGSEICAPNPKTYYAVGPTDKHSCKGLPKNQNLLNIKIYKRVLKTGMSHVGRVSKFVCETKKLRDGKGESAKLVRRDSERIGISYLFTKRRLDDNGITTKPILL